MTLHPVPRVLIAGALLIAPSLARADLFYETSYLSSGTVVVPTSSVVSTTSYVPTSSTYLMPTSTMIASDEVIYPTSYVTGYRPVRYRPRRSIERTSYYVAPRYSLAPRSYVVPSSYLMPTSYYVPTSYVSSSIVPTSYLFDSGVVTTSMAASPCDETAAPPMPTARRLPPPVPTSPAERPPSSAVQSTPSSEPAAAEFPVTPQIDASKTHSTKPVPPVSGASTEPAPAETGASPPSPTFPELPKPGQIDPKAAQPPEGSGTQTRESLKAIYSTPVRIEPRAPVQARNVLRGRVVSYEGGKPEEGVTVYLTSRTGAFTDRTTQTDADGHFAVTLPDGDWAVKVRMPSGNVRNVGGNDVTASAGRIIDAGGRGVQEFVITR